MKLVFAIDSDCVLKMCDGDIM